MQNSSTDGKGLLAVILAFSSLPYIPEAVGDNKGNTNIEVKDNNQD